MKIQRNSCAAEAEVQKELKSNPEYVPALMAQAALDAQRGQAKSATETYSDILRRWPDFAPAQKRLATIYAQDPSTVAAAYDLATKARKTLPDDPRAVRASRTVELREEGISAGHSVITGKRSETAARCRFSFLSGYVSAPSQAKGRSARGTQSSLGRRPSRTSRDRSKTCASGPPAGVNGTTYGACSQTNPSGFLNRQISGLTLKLKSLYFSVL